MTKRFLIGQLARYGDCLFATTLAKQIKHDFPDSHTTWAVASNFMNILVQNPHVDQVWEVPVVGNDYYLEGWKIFEKEALRRKAEGDFDEVIFSQIPPLNWENYTGTIRGTILSAYKRPITVDVSPVIRLTETEVCHVAKFAEEHKLLSFKNVILFECAPASDQSDIDVDFAVQTAEVFCKKYANTCFILS